ncbi:MAG: auracyanin [Chloroflexi bacterium AL-W]|nr:auracyanin [Chloroflexi bacterium AL-N1]NOK68288.1 auracyanin [Chloroflexi bacterium AL-N10]NOK73934.1 auracyanin [Chloroflexi bacterium AL-N5]NOK82902.1 auracyanin [Chloroflexi bacterium AL-W]NOK90424.1 auracyanin [Chloroflexi bacterium AL-N15]
MNFRTRFGFFSALIAALFILAACGNGGGGGAASTEHTIASDPSGFAYQQTEVAVPVGEQISVTFENASNVEHNWVLVRGGEDVAQTVNTEGNAAGGPTYLPEDQSNIIAATAMLEGGSNETITFTIDEPDDYRYICTFPGHYPTMAGTLTAQ